MLRMNPHPLPRLGGESPHSAPAASTLEPGHDEVVADAGESALKHRRRVQGFTIAIGISLAVWAAIAVGIVALVNALN